MYETLPGPVGMQPAGRSLQIIKNYNLLLVNTGTKVRNNEGEEGRGRREGISPLLLFLCKTEKKTIQPDRRWPHSQYL